MAPLTPSIPAVIPSLPSPTRSPVSSVDVVEIFRQVERLRGIEPLQHISYTTLTQTEIDDLTRAAWLRDWPLSALEREMLWLQAFGLSGEGTDLDDLTHIMGLDTALVASLAGDGLAISLNLGATDAGLLQVVCAYERQLLTQAFHATDPSAQTEACVAEVDVCLARRALIEGDAALLSEQWLRTFGSSSASSNRIAPCGVPRPAVDVSSTPLLPVLAFPPDHGLEFARAVYLKTGWAGVDQAHANPPVSTEQILHPERYPKDTPRPPDFVDPAPILGPEWATEDSGTLGEWRTRLVLQAYLDPDQAALAAEGWDGDHYALLANPSLGLRGLVLLTRYDTVRDAHEFSGAFRTYGEHRFGPGRHTGTALTWATPSGVVILDVGNDQTLWIEAPDATMAATLRKASGFPLY